VEEQDPGVDRLDGHISARERMLVRHEEKIDTERGRREGTGRREIMGTRGGRLG
jgi:hypothetical protein